MFYSCSQSVSNVHHIAPEGIKTLEGFFGNPGGGMFETQIELDKIFFLLEINFRIWFLIEVLGLHLQ